MREIHGDEIWDVCCLNCGCPRSLHHIGISAEVAKGCLCGCAGFEPRTVHDAWALHGKDTPRPA